MHTSHILIVDNDPMAALVTQHGLQRMLNQTAAIEIAPSPDVAQDRCQHEQIDLLIIDPSSESSAETALLKEIHRTHPEIAVMVLTAYDTPRLRSQMRSLGVQYYLAKPVELHDLGKSVRLVVSSRAHSSPNV